MNIVMFIEEVKCPIPIELTILSGQEKRRERRKQERKNK
jgi:hypothetical protein